MSSASTLRQHDPTMDDDAEELSPQISRVEESTVTVLEWISKLSVSPRRIKTLYGDKLNLPPTALEALLAAAPTTIVEPTTTRSYTSAFDPFNPYTFTAERQARSLHREEQKQLPHPLTFKLTNAANGQVIYAGIREFSASDGEVELSDFLRTSLGVPADDEHGSLSHSSDSISENRATRSLPIITITATQLPKGKFVRLRPLEAGYDPEDWKSLLEQHLRSNFTTLTNGQILEIPHGRDRFRFRIDGFKPEGEAICVVDTDIEVDIEALNEEQARETVKQIAYRSRAGAGTTNGSSTGGDLSIFESAKAGQVAKGGYADYQVTSWPRDEAIDIELNADIDNGEIDLYVSPFGPRGRVRPRDDDHVWSDISGRPQKRIRIEPKKEALEEAEAIYISVHAFTSQGAEETASAPRTFSIRVSNASLPASTVKNTSGTADADQPPNLGEIRCKNCLQWISSASLMLHENFCLRNNVLCPHGCGRVFQKRSETFTSHWHCEKCLDFAHTFGDTAASRLKHEHLVHTPTTCPEATCGKEFDSVASLAQHRSTTCAGKLILCQFCHLQVAQGEATNPATVAECMLSNLTPHELADGARTTECHLCDKIVRLRDMRTHLMTHELEKSSRPRPRVCRNILCGRTLDGADKVGNTRASTRMGNGPGNDMCLCSTCFGPLYISQHDPEGKVLKRRVERRYLSQLVQGCGKTWCRNSYCKTGRNNTGVTPAAISTKDAVPLIRPFLDPLLVGDAEADGREQTPLHFCVDEASQRRRTTADMLSAEGVYAFEWCLAALEAEQGNLNAARAWLDGWAPKKGR